jgi:hypothetical protein
MNGKIRRNAMHKFYFIKPKPNTNSEELALKLIGLKHVDGVFLTEGEYGFIVKARVSGIDGKENVADYISENVGSSYGEVTSYFEYRKR